MFDRDAQKQFWRTFFGFIFVWVASTAVIALNAPDQVDAYGVLGAVTPVWAIVISFFLPFMLLFSQLARTEIEQKRRAKELARCLANELQIIKTDLDSIEDDAERGDIFCRRQNRHYKPIRPVHENLGLAVMDLSDKAFSDYTSYEPWYHEQMAELLSDLQEPNHDQIDTHYIQSKVEKLRELIETYCELLYNSMEKPEMADYD